MAGDGGGVNGCRRHGQTDARHFRVESGQDDRLRFSGAPHPLLLPGLSDNG